MRELEIWSVDLSAGAGALCALGQRLALPGPADTRAASATASASPTAIAADLRRAAHVALRLLLARDVGLAAARVAFEHGAMGKPTLTGGPQFSLSHAGALALVAVGGTGAVGVDLEAGREVRITAARRHGLEAAAVALAAGRALPGNTETSRFLASWVRLEAVAKAAGDGIGAVLEEARATGPAGVAAWAARCATTQIADLEPGEGYVGAVAVIATPGMRLASVLPLRPFPTSDAAAQAWVAALPP